MDEHNDGYLDPGERKFIEESWHRDGVKKPLRELLEAYTWHGSRQQDNLDTLVESDEMARRLQKLDELDWKGIAAPFGGLSTEAERAAWKAAVDTSKYYVRRILDSNMSMLVHMAEGKHAYYR